ncbi:AAA family ATPase [Actinoplanes sp. NPDC049265]|uniref:AAA family ATPase n=1 Tax=Actinoplanes sp. NPDC049265 TaxID=3363902 RepID=UPI003720EE10
MSLIGRARELAAVRRLLDRAAAGTGGQLVVSGPPGSGRTALADAAAAEARARGLDVVRAAGDAVGATVDGHADSGRPRLVVLDDLDRAGPDAVAELHRRAPRLPSGATAILATVGGSAGDLRLAPLTRTEVAALVPGLSPDAAYAVWLASAGRPGTALDLAAELTSAVRPGAATDLAGGFPGDGDVLVGLALSIPSRAEFLDLDVALIRLLEEAATRPVPPAVRARVLARLARELLGDASAAGRRRKLVEEATALAREAGDPGVTAEVLDCRLHALWDPAAAAERLGVASEIVDCARAAGDTATERRGLLWRFTALAELGELDAAEATLAAYAKAGDLDGDPAAEVVVPARQAMLAIVRGRFDLAESLTREVAERGRAAGIADTDRLTTSLSGRLALLRGTPGDLVTPLLALARRLPGHYFEATAARVMAETGRLDEARLELDRLLPAVLAGGGPRWLGAVADLAWVASFGPGSTHEPAVRALHDALEPYAGRLIVWGGANMIVGPVDEYLGRLAMRLGRTDVARAHLDRAAALAERLGALPWLASILELRGDARSRDISRRLGLSRPDGIEWSLHAEDADWRLRAGTEDVRVRDCRGLHHLRALLAAGGREISALDLAAGGAGLRPSPADPVLDDTGRATFRRRLAAIDDELAAADRAGDTDGSTRLVAERSAVLRELRQATGLGGRPRRPSAEAERARVSVTRTVRTALARIAAVAPLAGAHLQASIRTGAALRYQPAPGGPDRWRV